MYFFNKLVALIFLHVSSGASQLYEGDRCQLKNGKNGICKLIEDCPGAIADLQKRIYPVQCGFVGIKTVVCCAQSQSSIQPEPPQVELRTPGVISNEKCVEYSRYIWEVKLAPTLTNGEKEVKKRECPFNRQNLVVGTTLAKPREFPHMVQLGYELGDDLQWACGGSLISEQYILTTAHCLLPRWLGDVKYARMGLEDLGHMHLFNVTETIPHPKYKIKSFYHDIGLAKLNRKAVLNTWVRPACLYTKNYLPWSQQVIESSWNRTIPGTSTLLRIVLELFDQPQCNKTYGGSVRMTEGINNEIMICAGNSEELMDISQGGSGGPLQIYKDGEKELSCMYEVVGITSFGKAIGLTVNIPNVYTRVSHYVKWIEDIVWPQTV